MLTAVLPAPNARAAIQATIRAALLAVALCAGAASPALAQPSLATLAKQQGCTGAPVVVEGTDLYKCQTNGAMSYFSGPPSGATSTTRKASGSPAPAPSTRGPSPASFPRVESSVQRERDDVRKRVLTEELATEVRML